MSDSSGEELDRILQPNKEKLPSLPRHDPPDDLSDDEEFAEKLRQIKESYQNKPLPCVTKQTPIVRRLDDDRDDYGGHSDREDEWSSRGRQSEASSRRDVFSTSTSNSKNTFDMSRARLSDVFPRRMENQSRRDDSDKDSDDSSGGGLLERVVPERRQEMRRVAGGNNRESNSRNSRRFEFDTRIRARPSQRPSESTRPRDSSRSRSRHQEQSSSSPSRRNAAPRRPLPKDPRRKDPSDHEDLDNELDAEISGLVGRDSFVERPLSPGEIHAKMVFDKISRRMAEQKRWREAAPPPNDFDEPMIDDDDLPSRLRVLKEPKSSRPKPSEPTRITGDWDELPTSSEAAKTPQQGVKRPTMTDFFKPSPRPGRVPDQPPHRDLEGFKKTAVEWLNAKAVPAVKSAQGAGGSGTGPKQLHRSEQAAPKPLQTPGTSKRAPEQAASKQLQTPGRAPEQADSKPHRRPDHADPKQLQRSDQAAPKHRDPQRPEQAAPKPLQAPGSQGRLLGHPTSKQHPRPEQAAPRHRDPHRPDQGAAKLLQTPGRAPEHAAPKPLQIAGTSRRALEHAALKTPQTPGGQGRLERLAGHPPSSKQLLRPEQAAPRHRDPQRPDQAAPKALQTPGGQGRLAGQPSSEQLRTPGTSGRAPEQAASKQLHRLEHRPPKPLQTPGTSGRRPEHAALKHPHRQAAPRRRTPSPALLEPKIEVFSDDDDNHFSDLDHHAPRTPYDPNKTAKSLAKMDAVNKKHKANLDAKFEAKRREYELMEAELEKKRAVLEEYARREEQEKRRRRAEEAERRRPKSPVRVQKFICHTCGRHFISQKKLDDHKHSHTDNVQAICPMCNTEIKFKYNLRQHMTKCQERLKEKMGNQGVAEYYPEFAAAVKIAAEDPCLDLPPLPKGFVMLENGLVVGHDPMLDVNTSLLLKSFREEGAAMARKDKSKKNTMRRQKRDAPQDITLSDDDDDNDDDQPEPNGRGRGTRGRVGRNRGGARGARGGGARGARGGARTNRHMEESEPDSFDDSDY
ncbi:hypothetical protein CAEBREN_19383 [Caenorhabditis brenneri]|uniref:C2H2-type domain-containing protein n=1 Tax=Caenorhabditis brenneri TaxID=135651 RepID=G0PFJ8_CAEBE|nr:hypothetical protein CAEBREN_19383 [Caenorhabditis brenneri]